MNKFNAEHRKTIELLEMEIVRDLLPLSHKTRRLTDRQQQDLLPLSRKAHRLTDNKQQDLLLLSLKAHRLTDNKIIPRFDPPVLQIQEAAEEDNKI